MSGSNKLKLCFICIVIIVMLLTITCNATNVSETIINEIQAELEIFKSNLSNDVLDFLPEGVWKGDFSSLLSEDFNEKTIFEFIMDYLFLGLNDALKSFCVISVIIIISSLFNTLSSSFSSIAIKNSFNLASSICASITVFNLCSNITHNTVIYLNGLCKAMECFAPLMSTLYILTGNLTSGGVASASFVLFISVIENALVKLMVPIIYICISFSIIKSLGGYFDLSGISKTLKNTFTGVTVFVMSIFMFVLSCKSILSQSNDSISIKTAKFAISSFIPIVGSTVNDALRTITSSISLIKNSCGIIALLVIALMMLPQIISLLLYRLLFNITSSMAKCLKCDTECTVIEEASSVCGFLLALVICTCILFIFAITIMIKSTVVI